VDLRNGKAVRDKILACRKDQQDKDQDTKAGQASITTHPLVRAIVEASMLETSPGPYAAGNWGLWNFGGHGPEGPPAPAVVGEPGGCRGQCSE
jgi:hypothetical protein